MYENITAKVELITPEVAEELLKQNGHNRKQTKSNIKVIEKALVNEEWQVSGQTIIIASNGQLMDGQHRLQAVVNTGIPMYHLVCRGVASSVFTVIDTGKVRTGSDTLSIDGSGNSVKVASVIKMFNAYKLSSLKSLPKMSNTEILKEYTANQVMYDNALDDGKLYLTANMLNDVQWATLSLAMSTVIKGEEYLNKLVKGDFPKVADAIRIARKQGASHANSTRTWVAVFAGYGYFIKGKTDEEMPQSIRTSYSENRRGVAKQVPLKIAYPHD